MINTQIAFLAATAIGNLNHDVNLDDLVQSYEITDEEISSAERFSNNHVVLSKSRESIKGIVNHITANGVNIASLYASETGPTIETGGSVSADMKQFDARVVGASQRCHSNCHSNCHGSRGWR